MKFTNGANINMTGLKGEFPITFAELCEIFGRPDVGPNDRDMDKVTCEWKLKFDDGTVASIYDYRVGYTPMGEYEWHIGGHDNIVVHRIVEMIHANRDQLVKMVRDYRPDERTTG
jgi:hypothetical protein